MMSVQKFAFAALVAAAAAGLAGPARADLDLTITQGGLGSGGLTFTGSSTSPSSTSTSIYRLDNSFSGFVLRNGYGFSGSNIASVTPTAGGGETLDLSNIQLRKFFGSTGSPLFGVDISYTATPADVAAGFAPGTLDIQGTIDATSVVPRNGPPIGGGVYFPFSLTETLNPDGNGGFTVTPPSASGSSSPSNGAVTVSNVTATYTPAAAALPEPAGVLAGLLGLPCAGGVLALARRRLAAVVA